MHSGMRFIVGVDEAGRGPLAGPVSVGAIIVPQDFDILVEFRGVNDSKQLTEKKREQLFALLEHRAGAGDVRFHVELIAASAIDGEGITTAVRIGLERGVRVLLPEPADGKVFLDGLLHAPLEYEQETVVGGDALIPAIMLASVAAKVVRDRHMVALGAAYPHYSFEKHKGYGTKAHYAALKQHGLCPEHRRSYLSKFLADSQT